MATINYPINANGKSFYYFLFRRKNKPNEKWKPHAVNVYTSLEHIKNDFVELEKDHLDKEFVILESKFLPKN